ncbi:MAG: hypothetical protein UR26_C0002G0084 [candidate division TM6 bacterium GW2011_GWF2_32_72]|nr:MAG: hypothetical protein UR26_C0002G0084 [candidate division TM6 bacterium GW2011_GWF2_32_72]
MNKSLLIVVLLSLIATGTAQADAAAGVGGAAVGAVPGFFIGKAMKKQGRVPYDNDADYKKHLELEVKEYEASEAKLKDQNSALEQQVDLLKTEYTNLKK